MKKYIIQSIALLLGVSSLTSCLKDDSLVLDPAKGHNVIEFANPAQIAVIGSPYAMYVFSYELADKPSLPITVSYSGPEQNAPQDISVNIAVGTDASITAYNTAQNGHYVMMSPSNYAFTGATVVIKAGTSKATFNIPFDPSKFDLSKQEVLPLTITSASSGIVSGNFGTILLNVNAKNLYDGIFSMEEGSFVQRYAAGKPTDPAVDGLNGSLAENDDITLSTISANTVQISNLKWHGNSSGVGGIDNLQVTVDPATNLVTMRSISNTTLANIAGKVNKWDPATKTLTLNFDWNQATNKREMGLVIKFKAKRP
jgi:hypothetical protein